MKKKHKIGFAIENEETEEEAAARKAKANKRARLVSVWFRCISLGVFFVVVVLGLIYS
ncbi:MAG: hypothetical protein LBP26_05615 [Clostridiales bacterium]|jgi:hypothetical protein|nr:hypothetical protein [Clostridiales bacterium]